MTATSPLVLKIGEESGGWDGAHDPSGGIVVTRSLVATPPPPPTRSFVEPDPLDVRLHAPTKDTVIVWVAGPIRRADAHLLAYGPADAVLAVLAARTTEAPMENAQ